MDIKLYQPNITLRKKIVFSLIGFLILWANLSVLITFLEVCYRSDQSKNWPTTRATVISSHAYKKVHWSKFGRSSTYKFELTYSYFIAGKNYISDRYLLDDARVHSLREARDYAIEYRGGQTINIYYDPRDPQRATLVTDHIPWSARTSFAYLPFVFSCLAAYLYILFFLRRHVGQPMTDIDGTFIHFGNTLRRFSFALFLSCLIALIAYDFWS